MNLISRRWSLLGLIAVFALMGWGCMRGPTHNFPNTVADAQKRSLTNPSDAIDEYMAIRDKLDATDPAQAAEALVDAAKLAADPSLCGTPAQVHADPSMPLSATTKEAMLKLRSDCQDKGRQALLQLTQYYPHSQAMQEAQALGLLARINDAVDARNKGKLLYRMVDFTVGLTGRIPSFSYWFALMLIAVVVKIITMPLMLRTYKSQREMQRIQPELKQIQERFKGKPEMQQKMMECYKKHGVSPFASCVPMLIQYPFLMAVFYAIRLYEIHFSHGTFLWIGSSLAHQYPGQVAANLGEFDMILLLLYAASNYVTMKLTPPADPNAAQQQKSMSLIMTAMMFFMFLKYRWSAAFMLYWLATNVISAWQQYQYIYKPNKARLAFGVASVMSAMPDSGNGASLAKSVPSNGSRTNGPAPTQSTALRPRPRRKPRGRK